MSRLILAIGLLMLCGCFEHPKYLVGTTKIFYDWVCLKEETDLNPGMNFDGDFIVTMDSHCVVSRCMKHTKTYGTSRFSDQIQRNEIVDDNLCLN